MKIKVYPQLEFNNTVFTDDNVEQYFHDFFICLNSSGHIYSIPHFKLSHDNVINTYFDDTDIDRIKTTGDLVYYARACTTDQAVKIRNFIDTIPQDATVHIYCAKGQSRSPAVAKFIEEYKNSNTDNVYCNYNHHVYQLLRAVC